MAHISDLRTGSSSAGVRSASIPVTLGAISRASLLLGLAPLLSSCFLFPTTCGTLPPGSSAGPFVVVVCIFTYLSVFGGARAPRPHRLFSPRKVGAALQWRRSPCCRRRLRVPELALLAPTLWRTGSVVGVHLLSCSTARGVSAGIEPVAPARAAAFFASEPAGGPQVGIPTEQVRGWAHPCPSPLPTPARQEGCWCGVPDPLPPHSWGLKPGGVSSSAFPLRSRVTEFRQFHTCTFLGSSSGYI